MNRLFSCLLIALFATSHALAQTADETKSRRAIVVHGSSSMSKVIQKISAKFGYENGVGVSITDSNSVEALYCVRKNECDLALSSTELNSHKIEGDISKLEGIDYGWDSLVVMVNPGVGVHSVTNEQLKGLFSGKIKNWKDVGGKDLTVQVFRHKDSKIVEDSFKIERVVGSEVHSTEEARNRVKVTPGAIGTDSVIGVPLQKKMGFMVLGIDGIAGTFENISAGKYNFVRRKLLLVRRKDSAKDAVLGRLIETILADRHNVFVQHGLMMP